MNKQANLTLVVFATLVVAAVMMFITGTPYQSTVEASSNPASFNKIAAVNPATENPFDTSKTETAEIAEAKRPIVSPIVNQMNPTQFLAPIPVGKKAPNFSIKDANGKTVQLSQYSGKKNVVVVFYSGNKCPVCGQQLENLQNHLQDFKTQDAEIIAISADTPTDAKKSIGEHGLSFTIVPDTNKEIIKLFGIANVSHDGAAWPSSFVIDKQGIVRLSVADPGGKRLHSNELLPALSKITNKAAPQLQYDE